LIVTKGLFLRGQLNRKLKDIHLGHSIVLEKIGANNYMLEMQFIVRINPLFHVNNIRPYSSVAIRHVPVTTYEDDDVRRPRSHINF
jgi:hypothetical protein